jgi:peroxiredoxin (alkyl hydroperoxide reductase subunit C)
MAELTDGCVQPVKGPIAAGEGAAAPSPAAPREAKLMQARVGQKAIDFEASAFIAGKGFRPVKLSDYKGQWIVVCFYPGDFTFV